MTRVPTYTARDGLIWTAGNHTVRTVAEALEAAPHLIDAAVEARTDFMATVCTTQLADLVDAIRSARAQQKAANDATPDQPKERAA